MTTWIETTNVKQDGTPVTRRIKIEEMDEEIWFTDNAYAETADDVADILANNIDAISKVSEPSSPGTYYGDAGDNVTVEIVVADAAFDNVTVEKLQSDSIDTERTTITQSSEADFSQYNPHVDRSPELDAAWGVSPAETASNPVMDASQISHRSAVGVADPFVRWDPDDGLYHVLVESLDSNGLGDITHYTSPDLHSFTYDGQAFDNGGSHVSWPFVFKWDGTWYMVPATGDEFAIYEQGASWTDWQKVETTLSRSSLGDVTPFYWNGRWYFIARVSGTGVVLYYADSTGDQFTGRSWSEHSASPILTETSDDAEGPCGRPIVRNGKSVDFPVQTETNPRGIRAFRITSLSTSSASVTELGSSPILRPQGNGWDGSNVHHCEVVAGGPLSQPKALIDGRGTGNWQIGLYDVGEQVSSKTIVGLGSNESVGTAWDKLNNLDDVRRDPLGLYDTSTQEWTVPADGDYRVSITYRYLSSDSSSKFLAMIRNETTSNDNIVNSVSGAGGGSYTMFGNSTELTNLSEGDVLAAYGGQSTGAGVDLNSPDTVVTFERLR